MDTILSFLPDGIALIILIVSVVILLVGMFLSSSMRANVKKGSVYLLILASISAGYYFFTGKSPADIPADINNFFNTPREPEELTHKYYVEPEKRYGDNLVK